MIKRANRQVRKVNSRPSMNCELSEQEAFSIRGGSQAVVIPNLRLFNGWSVEGTKDPVHYMFNPSMNYAIRASDNLSCAVVMLTGLSTKFPGSNRVLSFKSEEKLELILRIPNQGGKRIACFVTFEPSLVTYGFRVNGVSSSQTTVTAPLHAFNDSTWEDAFSRILSGIVMYNFNFS